MQRALAALADLAEAARDNKGVFHTMIYDDQAGEDARKVIHELAITVAAAHSAATRLDALLARIEQGPGGAYALLYGQEGITIAENLAQTSDDIKTVMGDARNGQGLLHELVYGTDGPKAISELAQASERLDRIMGTIEAGEGTLGGLLVDPTVYEDLKTLIGNIDRNVLLKALVRFAIKEGDIRRPAVRPPQKKKSEGAAAP